MVEKGSTVALKARWQFWHCQRGSRAYPCWREHKPYRFGSMGKAADHSIALFQGEPSPTDNAEESQDEAIREQSNRSLQAVASEGK